MPRLTRRLNAGSDDRRLVTRRLLTLAAVMLAIVLFFWFDLDRFLRLATLQQNYEHLLALYDARPLVFIAAFMLVQMAALTLCLPGAVLSMAVAAGAIFGPVLGTLVALTAMTAGDSLGFLAARFLIGDWVRRRFAAQLEEIEAEVDRNGAFYLLSLRLMAAIPYFVINLTFGATRMRLRTFAPVSFAGLAPAAALYVNAGTRLSQIRSPGDVLSVGMVVSLGLLALVPLAVRFIVRRSSRSAPEL